MTMRAASSGCMRGWTGRRVSAANISAIECKAWLGRSADGFARRRQRELSYRRKYPLGLRFQNGLNPFLAHVLKDALPVCPRSGATLMHPQTIDLDHGRLLFDSLRSTPSGCSIASSSVSGLKPSRSRRALGTTIRPALSILSSMPITIQYAIINGHTPGTQLKNHSKKSVTAAMPVASSFPMHARVACSAQRNQILLHIATRVAAELEVVYLQVLHATANLASPAVALQHLPMQFAVAVRIESESRALAADLLHEAFRLTSERKASCCGLGRNL